MPQLERLSVGQRLRRERLAINWSQERLAEALETSVMTVRRWEHDVVLPQPRFREALCRFFHHSNEELFGMPATEQREIARSEFWTVPYLRNPYFTGREDILETLHTRLTGEQPVSRGHALALTGLGGVGKTQIALEYAYRYASEHRMVFWLIAENAESTMRSLQSIADLLQLPAARSTGQEKVVTSVRRWLTAHTDWLLIVDNVGDPDLLQGVLPPTRQGAILLTTRAQALGTLAELLVVPPMQAEEGAMLVLRRARIVAAQDIDALAALPQTTATELVNLLEGLPLALDQAGSYIEETGCSIADYLQRYSSQRKALLARRGIHAGVHPDSVYATLQLSMHWIEQVHPAAAELLRLCAFLHAEAIPEELLLAGKGMLGPVLEATLVDLYHLDLVLATLRNASLITRHPETYSLTVHRLVQAVFQDQMELTEVALWSQRAVRVVNAAFPAVEFAIWSQCERYLAHACACLSWLESAGDSCAEAGELCYKAGFYLMIRGRYEEAEPLLRQSVELGEQYYGSEYPLLIPRLLRLAELYYGREKHQPTEQLLQRALAIGEQHLPPTHPSLVETLNALARLYRWQQKYEQANLLYQRASRIQEQQLQSEQPETVVVLVHLATMYQSQGKYERAEPLYQRALRVQERQLGSRHPQLIETLNALATLYYEQDKYELAEPLYLRAIHIQEQQLHSEHPKAALVLANLAELYRMQGKYEEAQPLYQRALHIREQQLGPAHPEVTHVLYQLALLCHEQGQLEQAESLYQRALKICEQALGTEHPQSIKIRSGYTSLLKQKQDRLNEENDKDEIS
jgi:tetratricopeptide (TPR) repeat protein/transcriptional regulator with XRE-family HTH domain